MSGRVIQGGTKPYLESKRLKAYTAFVTFFERKTEFFVTFLKGSTSGN